MSNQSVKMGSVPVQLAGISLVLSIDEAIRAYDIFAINIASVMLGYVYGGDDHKLSIKLTTPIGILLGQLLFGWLADVSISAILGHAVNIYEHVDEVWRILIGLGCVPGVVALYFRLTISETLRYTYDGHRA
ncbi:hypothetical protein BDZ89DRAFT_1128320 [Hymenopellis radicata]|nr:hypothetical protein BDZ89DRAFT_1128320 [Hymenopellis radicata]